MISTLINNTVKTVALTVEICARRKANTQCDSFSHGVGIRSRHGGHDRLRPVVVIPACDGRRRADKHPPRRHANRNAVTFSMGGRLLVHK